MGPYYREISHSLFSWLDQFNSEQQLAWLITVAITILGLAIVKYKKP